ncbi:MAG: cryptochrome/photolyase family protein [Vulcanimicrobiaceae bacterium]
MRCGAIHLFTRDLRIGDHAGLQAASRSGSVVPAFILDPASHERFVRSPRRGAFFCGALAALAESFERAGTRLIVRRGPLVATVRRLVRELAPEAVVWSAAYDAPTAALRERLAASLEERGVRVVVVHDAPAVAPDESAARRRDADGRGYRSFVAYLAAWEAAPRAPIAQPAIIFHRHDGLSEPLPEPAEFGAAERSLDASEAAALAQLERFIAGPAVQYTGSRLVPSVDGTSRLGPALSFGTVSARTVLARLDDRARDPFLLTEERLALRSFARALARRDFFLQLAWFFEERRDRPLQAKMRQFAFARTHPQLERWRTGETGFPLVDAGMRELRATGWMHPRVRQIAASFLCFDLGVDWRIGRDAWDRELVEDDPALATGAWQWAAGVGADLAAYPRIFHPVKQARSIDPLGRYVRRWIPELAAAPDRAVLDPTAAARTNQLDLPLFDESAYPAPILNHEAAARAFLNRYGREVPRAVTPSPMDDYRARARPTSR